MCIEDRRKTLMVLITPVALYTAAKDYGPLLDYRYYILHSFALNPGDNRDNF
jgi:hypothetical protein